MRTRMLVTALLAGAAIGYGADSVAADARAALAKATAGMRAIATEGGYLWRYSADLRERRGEENATAAQIWVQPPGTPSVGMVFLRAYAATGDSCHRDAAFAAAFALVRGQLQSGGWDYCIDFDPAAAARVLRRKDAPPKDAARPRANRTMYDDDNTQSALRFLLACNAAAGTDEAAAPIREALLYGLAMMRAAQYPNGAWPQAFDGAPRDPARYPVMPARIPAAYPPTPPKESYKTHYTLNDDTQRDCIATMLEAYRRLGTREYRDAALAGADFLLLAQLPAPQRAWAQQYDARMEPAWARAFEPPAVCAAESVGAIHTLLDVYLETGDARYTSPIPAALAWYARVELRPGVWARFYELGTDKPIYGDRDGKVHYRLDEISEERRTGYSWEGGYGVRAVKTRYEEILRKGRDAYLAEQAARANRKDAPDENAVKKVLAALGPDGRWVVEGSIETKVFIRNVETLCAYLEAAGSAEAK